MTSINDVKILKATEWSNEARYSPICRVVIAKRLNTDFQEYVCWWENKHEKGETVTLHDGRVIEWDKEHDFYYGLYCETYEQALESYVERVTKNKAQFSAQFSTWSLD